MSLKMMSNVPVVPAKLRDGLADAESDDPAEPEPAEVPARQRDSASSQTTWVTSPPPLSRTPIANHAVEYPNPEPISKTRRAPRSRVRR